MFFRTFLRLASLASVAALYPLVHAQSKDGEALVPSDLSNGFDSQSISLQVSFDGNPTEGFADGTVFNKQQTSKAPSFALGDASGVNTAISFTILMVDTTTLTGRVLHYLQTDFQATEDQTSIASKTSPSFPYRAPGSMGETGDRQYTFLMFQTPSSGFKVKSIPVNGKNFDIGKWQSDNGLQDAMAGITMTVDCGAGGGSSSKKPRTTTSSTRDDTASSSSVTTSTNSVTVYITTKPSNSSTSRTTASDKSSSTTSSSTTRSTTDSRSTTTTGTLPRSTTGSTSSTKPANTTRPANSTARPTNGTANINAGNAIYTANGYRMVVMTAGLLVAGLMFMSL